MNSINRCSNLDFILKEKYGEKGKFERLVIYYDTREKESTKRILFDYIEEHIERTPFGEVKEWGKEGNIYYRIKLTGGKYLPFTRVEETGLDVGDYMYNGKVVELKRGFDLFNSINGEIPRLDTQIDAAKRQLREGLIAEYRVICTMEGGFEGNKFNEFNYFNSQKGLIPELYFGLDEAFKAMFNGWREDEFKNLSLNYTPEFNPAVQVMYGLQKIPPSKRKKVYYEFKPFYINDLRKITKPQLLKIKGIGETTANKIIKELDDVFENPADKYDVLTVYEEYMRKMKVAMR